MLGDDGNAFGAVIELGDSTNDVVISLNDLKSVKTVNLPRPFPTFLSYYFNSEKSAGIDVKRIVALQLSVGPGIDQNRTDYSFAIESVRLEK